MRSPDFATAAASSPRRLFATALGLAFAVPAAAAEPAATPAPDALDPQHATKLGEVAVRSNTVNAASPKLTAPLLDTPRAVSVIPKAVIQSTASTTLTEALRTVPGITFAAGEGGTAVGDRPLIRGFDAVSDIYVDGIRDTGTQTRETFDVEQIDVIKGPSSAYTGRGSAGGSINIVTKAPKAENFTDASLGLGTDNYKRATLDAREAVRGLHAFSTNA